MMTRKPGDMHDEVPKLTRLFSDKERILIKESQWKYGLWHIAAVFLLLCRKWKQQYLTKRRSPWAVWGNKDLQQESEEKMTGKKDDRAINRLSEQEEKIIEQIRKIDYGEIRVVVNGGQPTRLEEVKKSIKL